MEERGQPSLSPAYSSVDSCVRSWVLWKELQSSQKYVLKASIVKLNAFFESSRHTRVPHACAGQSSGTTCVDIAAALESDDLEHCPPQVVLAA